MLTITFKASEKTSLETKNPATDRAQAEGARIFAAAKKQGIDKAAAQGAVFSAEAAAQIADGALRASYVFDKYKTTPAAKGPSSLTIETDDPAAAEKAFAVLKSTTESVFWASDFINEPANVLNPQTYAGRVKAELEPLGIKVRILEADEMKALGMGAITAVGQGSLTPPRMVVLEYDGTAGAQKQPLALVGKGITFDSGGISIKPGANMGNMTMDMSGSAAVAGALRSLALRGAKTRVVGVLALAENMPDNSAVRPGDIVKSLSGKTIFVGNTDAEGRLVLADAMTYVQKNYDPHTVVDIATLTGAAAAALGSEFAAAFSNDDRLFAKFNKAATATGEKIWRMPLTESGAFRKAVQDTPHADLTNNASGPGALTAAAFLREFIEKKEDGSDKRKFVHLDIAGPGMPASALKGWGVYLFDRVIRDNFEQKAAANDHDCQCGGTCSHDHGAGGHHHGPHHAPKKGGQQQKPGLG